ncbi:Rieske 2Fe-2S domain-containing protein [Deinococcus radiotolerans]|uniref:Cytochrome Complex iron-sulfur subunit n=1 Tax=Deinococcus radiotolerans TaxID=1309407 RepID=A0ABQ2FLU4_9DEIO|nr:Rieske 2Fe-2S domain-containing protein [Deinococcus radiotolerans]GGL04006.1 cytochrome Complex iron-sulfur subunit [Deinococcus radiotolerans]
MTRYKKQDPEITRRKFINAAMGTSAGVGVLSLVSALGSAKPVFRLTADVAPPMKGDVLVHAEGPNQGQIVKASELSDKLIRAYPKGSNPKGGEVIRDKDPTNILAVYKFAPGTLKDPTKLDATVDGQIVVYGDRCMHAGCNVGDDPKGGGQMFCPCHSGQYDATQGCRVTGGPPPAPLPQLPIKQEGDQLVVTGFFLSRPYGFNKEEDWEDYIKKVEEAMA